MTAATLTWGSRVTYHAQSRGIGLRIPFEKLGDIHQEPMELIDILRQFQAFQNPVLVPPLIIVDKEPNDRRFMIWLLQFCHGKLPHKRVCNRLQSSKSSLPNLFIGMSA